MHGGTMGLFHSFNSQEERRKCGGSDYIELQYCRFPVGTETKKIISVNRIRHWENDSLYVYGEDSPLFYASYGTIITGGIYNNMRQGSMDLYGINFYSHQQAQQIIQRLVAQTPPDYQPLLHWLQSGTNCIGFYLLGV